MLNNLIVKVQKRDLKGLWIKSKQKKTVVLISVKEDNALIKHLNT